MTTLTLPRKKFQGADLASVQNLAEISSVATADLAARAAQVALNEIESRVLVLDQHAQSADALTQRAAERERRQLWPQLEEAADRAESARRVAEETRESARRQVVDAHRAAFADKLTRLGAKWLEAENEARELLVWLDQLAGVVGHAGLLSHWIAVIPTGLRPGGHAEWSERLPGAIGVAI